MPMPQGGGDPTRGRNRLTVWWRPKRDRAAAFWHRNRKAIRRRFVLGAAYGAGSGAGGLAVGCLVWLIQSR
ncbi:hypothetical protein [Streptomyces sp. cf124]|uniref:hypothetical protein n=1 Tax=Streptomyces sp. cf124 TaxID=1761903 RepID=UPI00116065CF|nr:hypothetical protein [Streptomyces sp. cf124]